MIIVDDTNTCNECGAYYVNKNYCVNGHYIDALEQAIILLDDNPNITDECDGIIVSNEPDIAQTLFKLKKEIEKG
tara:strand:+ start:412 stop:636 length:225 start_codon:yes stop_codon:yes gene_type:complete